MVDSLSSLSDVQIEIYDFVNSHSRSVTAPEVSDALSIPRTTTKDNLGELVDIGVIQTAKSGRTRLYHTASVWGENQILSDRVRSWLEDGCEDVFEKQEVLNQVLGCLQDYPREIPFNQGPKRSDVELITSVVGVEKPIEELTYLELTGYVMQSMPERNGPPLWDWTSDVPNKDKIQSCRYDLGITQEELGQILAAEHGRKTESTYHSDISKWESEGKVQLTKEEIQTIVEYLWECKNSDNPRQKISELVEE